MAHTGYKIIVYIDLNPQSPTFNTTKEERVADSTNCGVASADWQVISSYCELDDSSQNTGYYITTEMDINVDSSTYGEVRENRVQNLTECPLASKDPNWVINVDECYCETMTFPSGLEGETGNFILSMTDENDASPTFGQKQTSAVTILDWTDEMAQAMGEFPCEAVNMEPEIEEISSSCVMIQCNGKTTTNGQKKIFGLDKNPYSLTYLQSMESIIDDEANCPNGCSEDTGSTDTYIFTWDDGGTTETMNVGYQSQTLTIGVKSTKNGSSQDWSVKQGSATKTSTGISFQLSENTSTAHTQTYTFELLQSESNKVITLTVVQAKKSETCTPSTTTYYTVSNAKTSPSAVTYSTTSATLSWDYTEITDYVYEDCSTSSTTKTGSSSTSVTFTQNTSTSVTTKSGNYAWTGHKNKNGNTIGISWSVTQGAAPVTDQFTWGDGTTAKTVTVSSGVSTNTYDAGIISIQNGQTKAYSLYMKSQWIAAYSFNADGSKITITCEKNDSGKARDGLLSFTWGTDSEGQHSHVIELQVHQPVGTVYRFSFGDGTTTASVDANYTASNGSVALLSKKDSNEIGWTPSNTPTWVDLSSSTNSEIKWSTLINRQVESRSGTVTLTQDESEKEATLTFNQSGFTGETTEIYFYNSVTQEVIEDTTVRETVYCPQGGPTALWVYSTAENNWDDWLFEIEDVSMSGMIQWARFSTKNAHTAKVDIYWSSNCSGTGNRMARVKMQTPASDKVLTYTVIQRATRG